jgi:acetylornithine deacetylase/succinyl-diaminopimelate desuccinylase-like protein
MEEILRKLVAFPTVTGDSAAMHDLLTYVADFLVERGMHVEWFESNGFESIVATTKAGVKTPRVMLGAHADVVHAESDMFNLRVANSTYIGRGAYDMKFAIAAYMQIVEELRAEIDEYDFAIMLTSDEEFGGADGVLKLIDEGYLPEVCILPDGGDNWQIQTGSRGIQLYEISYAGRAAHGARPWLGDNALDKLVTIYDEIRGLFHDHPHPDISTVSLTRITGGDAPNQIPALASMTIDVRPAGSRDYQHLAEEIRRICSKHNATCRLISEGAPTAFSLEDPYIAPYVALVQQVTGTKVKGFFAPAASDARHYVPYGVPVISVYPTGGDHHGPHEWISINGCKDFKLITKKYLQEMALTKRTKAKKAAAPLTQAVS